MSQRLRTRVAGFVGVAVALAGLPSALATPAQPPQPPGCTSSAAALRYVVLFTAGTPESVVTESIRAACGTSTGYYPQIGVAVATSSEPSFTTRLGVDRAYSAQAEANTAQTETNSAPAPTIPAMQSASRDHVPDRREEHVADRSAEQWDMELIHGPQARAINPGSPDVVVGVLDSGIDPTHPDLVSALDPTRSAGCLSGRPDRRPAAWRPTVSTHGTHVAGTIAAADDGRGSTGVAPGVRLAAVKIVDDDGFIYPEYAVCGFMWAARQHMRIANSSYVVDPWLLTCPDVAGQAVAYEAVRRAVRYATAQGVLSVAALGNEGINLADPRQDLRSPNNARRPQHRPVDDDCGVLPAELPDVVAVSAVGAQRVKSGYSSYGRGVVTVTAPGGDTTQRPEVSSSGCVLSTIPGGYGYACGTSMATAHASGVAALLASSWPRATPEELAALLRQQADPVPCPPGSDPEDGGCAGGTVTSFTGYGLVDALKAVTYRPASASTSPVFAAGSADGEAGSGQQHWAGSGRHRTDR